MTHRQLILVFVCSSLAALGPAHQRWLQACTRGRRPPQAENQAALGRLAQHQPFGGRAAPCSS